jgi:adenosine 3'-phospho 5'-phosphosulfate transporter B2
MAPQSEHSTPEVTAAAAEAASERSKRIEQCCWCLFYGAGIIGTLVVYGILQEKIMTVTYGGPNGQLFEYSVFLIFINRVAAVIYAIAMALFYKESLQNKAPLWKYLLVSLSNVYASTCQYEALKYVSFAVQQLGKSFKMMPVMIWGMIISQKRYNLLDWLIAAAVTGGVTEFLLTGPTSSPAGGSCFKGFLFLLGFLALDGFTSTMQERLFKEHKTSKFNQLMYVNMLSSIVSLITLICTGTLIPCLNFFGTYPKIIGDSTVLAISAVASQFFIYSQVKEFGALVFAATMNVRQVVSIIVSYIKYNHHITGLQVLGLFIVFAALFYKSYVGLMSAPSKEEKAPLVPPAETAAEGTPASGDLEKAEKAA